MADTIRKVDYFYVETANKPGEAAKVLGVLRDAGVDLLAFSGFRRGARHRLTLSPRIRLISNLQRKKQGLNLVSGKPVS
jgi:hypothetical protein